MVIISHWLERLGGTQLAQKVQDTQGLNWVIKPFRRPHHGIQGTINEYVATCMAIRLGLPVPDIDIAYIGDPVISQFPQLAGYEEGFLTASRFEMGIDLTVARQQNLFGYFGANLGNPTNRFNAIGMMVGDTWLSNLDRSIGSLRQAQPMSNEGNIYLAQSQDGSGSYFLRAIDFGHAFYGANWGNNPNANVWPFALLGTMSFFFEMNWLSKSLQDCQGEIDAWLIDLQAIDVSAEIQNIVNSMPAEWVSALSNLPQPITTGDWQDLIDRIVRHQTALPSIIQAQYTTVAAWH